MSVEPEYNERNRGERERLAALVRRLTPEDLDRDLGHGWSVGTALAHLAFWDRLALAQLERWEQEGAINTPAFDSALINDAALPQWQLLAPDAITRDVLAAAEASDAKVAGLSQQMVDLIAAERPRALTRFNHRRMHLDEVEAALRT
jgi:hypothetical protein